MSRSDGQCPSPSTQHSAFAVPSLEHTQLLQTQPQTAQTFRRPLSLTLQTLRNPQFRTPKTLRKLKPPPSRQPRLPVKMLSKSIVLALAWSALSTSIARATPLVNRAVTVNGVDDSVPWFCTPDEFPVTQSYLWSDISEGIFT
jgi:hypothetical protein